MNTCIICIHTRHINRYMYIYTNRYIDKHVYVIHTYKHNYIFLNIYMYIYIYVYIYTGLTLTLTPTRTNIIHICLFI